MLRARAPDRTHHAYVPALELPKVSTAARRSRPASGAAFMVVSLTLGLARSIPV